MKNERKMVTSLILRRQNSYWHEISFTKKLSSTICWNSLMNRFKSHTKQIWVKAKKIHNSLKGKKINNKRRVHLYTVNENIFFSRIVWIPIKMSSLLTHCVVNLTIPLCSRYFNIMMYWWHDDKKNAEHIVLAR